MERILHTTRIVRGLAGLLMLSSFTAPRAAQTPASMEECAAIGADSERLSCYDRLSGRSAAPGSAAPAAVADTPPEAGPTAAAATQTAAAAVTADPSRLAQHWELDAGNKRGIFQFRPHRENYLVAAYNPSPNDDPYRPFRALAGGQDLSSGELAFQLGFKLKLAENPAGLPLDVWFGYTQRSFWQAGNSEASSPFRETDYQPELMAVLPTDVNLLGMRMRFLNLGLVHQSNGQGSTLSRSWNRAYLQAGFERGNFDLLARVWKRFEEDADEDNNPRIEDYLGHGDLVGTWHWNGHAFSLLTRYNFHTDKGAAQLGWAFPLTTRLKGYVQYFSGYGHTLVDYNAYQRVLGLGFLVTY